MTWIGWALLSAVFAAATALLAKVGVEHVDSNLAMALRTSVVVVFAWGIALALGKHGEIRSLDRRTVLFLALSGLATGLSWLCYFRALQLGPASRVAPLDKLSVPLVMVFAWLLLGEKLNGQRVWSAACSSPPEPSSWSLADVRSRMGIRFCLSPMNVSASVGTSCCPLGQYALTVNR